MPESDLLLPVANHRPLVLTLDSHGHPFRWVSWQHAVIYYSRNMVAWSLGTQCLTVRGGVCKKTGQRSEIRTHSIIAIRGKSLPPSALVQVPPLSNRELFHRDRQVCGYCGQELPFSRLTRDHIQPISQGGADTWMNVVTACRNCNQRKAGRTPEQARMLLLFAPYVPNKAEYLILSNRSILADQMDFLALQLPTQSRWCKR